MRALVFGATGFLGRHVAAAFTDGGHLVVGAGLDGPDETLDLAATGPAGIGALLRTVRPDVVVNCAGVIDGTPRQLVSADVRAVADLVTAWSETTPTAPLVHLGSAAEYGVTAIGRAVAEDFPERPVSAYGQAKLAATCLVRLAREFGHPAVVLRVFNPIGPGTPQTLLPGRLAAEIRRAARHGGRARLGSLSGARDFVDVRDVADAVLAAATAAPLLPPVLNIGSGHATELRDLAVLAASLAGTGMPEETAVPPPRRSAAALWQRADVSAARSSLAWRPRRALTDSLRDMGLLTAGAG
ncbi:NAD(P)-dependent oxidoreductase [Actinoplanes sp. NPDC049802]|uniref:NAD-dependent epimerase/dehydratase family protein n=1 Tax=Actinoplanes sp. NPDC049802 TaxID=3154742 RepID=UPI0033F82F96